MDDKTLRTLAVFSAIALVIWYAMQQNGQPVSLAPSTPAQSALPISWQSPMLNTYDSNPSGFGPASPSDVTVNIGNQSGNWLANQYVPLFGFTGVATGMLYQ